jgi:hypothetical protein
MLLLLPLLPLLRSRSKQIPPFLERATVDNLNFDEKPHVVFDVFKTNYPNIIAHDIA